MDQLKHIFIPLIAVYWKGSAAFIGRRRGGAKKLALGYVEIDSELKSELISEQKQKSSKQARDSVFIIYFLFKITWYVQMLIYLVSMCNPTTLIKLSLSSLLGSPSGFYWEEEGVEKEPNNFLCDISRSIYR